MFCSICLSQEKALYLVQGDRVLAGEGCDWGRWQWEKFCVLCGVSRAQQEGLKFTVVWTLKYYILIFIIVINQRISGVLHLKVVRISTLVLCCQSWLVCSTLRGRNGTHPYTYVKYCFNKARSVKGIELDLLTYRIQLRYLVIRFRWPITAELNPSGDRN